MPAATTAEKVATRIEENADEIKRAEKDLARMAKRISQRAAEAITQTDALINNQPQHQGWVEFLAADARECAEAKAKLQALYTERSLLGWLAR